MLVVVCIHGRLIHWALSSFTRSIFKNALYVCHRQFCYSEPCYRSEGHVLKLFQITEMLDKEGMNEMHTKNDQPADFSYRSPFCICVSQYVKISFNSYKIYWILNIPYATI